MKINSGMYDIHDDNVTKWLKIIADNNDARSDFARWEKIRRQDEEEADLVNTILKDFDKLNATERKDFLTQYGKKHKDDILRSSKVVDSLSTDEWHLLAVTQNMLNYRAEVLVTYFHKTGKTDLLTTSVSTRAKAFIAQNTTSVLDHIERSNTGLSLEESDTLYSWAFDMFLTINSVTDVNSMVSDQIIRPLTKGAKRGIAFGKLLMAYVNDKNNESTKIVKYVTTTQKAMKALSTLGIHSSILYKYSKIESFMPEALLKIFLKGGKK